MAEKVLILITAKDGASRAIKGVTNSFKGLNKAAADAALKIGTASALGLGAALAASIPIALDAEDVQTDLAATILSTGGAAGITAEEANALADSLASVTKESDETIVAAESMLLTFINIGEDVFPRATEMALNMGEKFGSVDSAAIQLGKALNDPIVGVGALAEVGVSFTEQQKEMIKTMVEAGNVAGAQAVILDELEVEVGGLARAMGQTSRGKIQRFINQMVDVGQVVGTKLTGPLGDLADTLGRFVTILTESGAASIQFQTTLVDLFGGDLGNQIFFMVNNLIDMVNIIREMGIVGVTTLQFWGELNAVFGSDIGNRIHELAVSFYDLYLNFKVFLDGVLIPFINQHGDLLISIFTKIGAVIAGGMIVTGIVGIGASIAALVNPVTLAIGAIVLLWQAWNSNLGGIQDFTKDKVIPVIEDFIQIVLDIWPKVKSNLEALATWFLDDALSAIVAFIKDDAIPAIKTFIEWLVKVWEDVKPHLQELALWFLDSAMPAIINILETSVIPILEAVVNGLVNLWVKTSGPLGELFTWILVNIVNGIVNYFQSWIDKVNTLISVLSSIWEIVGGPLTTLYDWVVKNIVNGISRYFEDTATNINLAVDAIMSLVDWIAKIDFGLLGDVAGFFGGIIPGRASGGPFSGLAMVGEEGRELVYAPGGAMVIPNGQSEGIINNFNLNTNTSATSAGVEQDFRMMEAFTG